MGKQRWLGWVVLVLVPLVLRLWPIEHGRPANHIPDTHIVRSALGMARDVGAAEGWSERIKAFAPPVGKYSTYPNLLPYALLPIYAGQYALGRVAGDWGGSAEYGNRLLQEPWRAHLPARILVALLAALAPLVVYRTARVAGLTSGAWVAAWLVATGLLHVHFSVQERPWTPLVGCMALSAWAAARHARDGAARDLIAAGVAAGLALACHQAGLVALGIPGIAWLCAPGGWRGAALRSRISRGAICVGACLAVALVLGHPYLLVHGLTRAESLAGAEALQEREGTQFSVGGQAILLVLRGATFTRLSRALFGYDPALLVLFFVGIVPALRIRALRPALIFALGWAAFFMTNQNDHVRYLLPLSVLLPLAAGAGAQWLAQARAGRIALGFLLLLPLVQAIRLGWVLRQTDTRALALAHLLEQPPADPIAVDSYGPELPLDRASLERLESWRPLARREAHRLLLLQHGAETAGGPGIAAIPMTALFQFELRDGSSWLAANTESYGLGAQPGPILSALGAREALLVDRFPADGRPSLIADPTPAEKGQRKLEPLVPAGPATATFDPSRGTRRATEARLPTEMDFALTALWEVDRPGPLIERVPLP